MGVTETTSTNPTRNSGLPDHIRRLEGLDAPATSSASQTPVPTPEVASANSQVQLQQFGGGHPVSYMSEPSAERKAQIDRFVEDKANETPWYDDNGGENVGAALIGDSSLGALTVAEQNYLARQSVQAWIPHQRSETIREAAQAVQDHPTARRALADAMSAPAAEEARHFEAGGSYLEQPGALGYRHEMLKLAVSLDPAKVVQNFAGVETRLGEMAMEEMEHGAQTALLESVANGRVNHASADSLVTSMFFHADAGQIKKGDMGGAMAGALARLSHPDMPHGQNAGARLALETRLTEILDTGDGRQLLFGREVHPELRAWALEQVTTNPDWTAAELDGGWQSDLVTTSYAEQVMARYEGRGTEPMTLGGEALRNTIGQTIGMQPTRLPGETETQAERTARLDAGLDHQYYEANVRIDLIAEHIGEFGGEDARVTVVPVVVTTEHQGATVHNVFRVEGEGGKVHFVDDQGLKYNTLEEWEDEARLPKGTMTYPEGLRPGGDLVEPRNTPAVVDTFWEHAGRVGDAVALGVGIVAGVVIVVGSGGTAAIVAAGAAGGYAASRAGAQLHDDAQRGIDIRDLSDPQVRSNWIDVAAGAFSVAAIGSGLRLANAARQGVQVSATAARSVAATQLVAEGLDAAAAANQIHHLASNWENLSNGQRAAGLLEVAFWGGMGVASASAGGARWQDGLNFRILEANLRNNPSTPSEYSRVVARELIGEVQRIEPPITSMLQTTAAAHGGHMEGLDFRFKSEDSLARKITTETLNSPGQPLDISGNLMNDVLRYTMMLDEGSYARGAQDTLDQLRADGFEISRINNAWARETGYQGLNVTVQTPDGHKFELQFHTEASFNAKEHLTHALYEELRLLPDGSPRAMEIQQEMNEIFAQVPVPEGVTDIE